MVANSSCQLMTVLCSHPQSPESGITIPDSSSLSDPVKPLLLHEVDIISLHRFILAIFSQGVENFDVLHVET